MSTFMQVTKHADGSVTLSLDTSMFAGTSAKADVASEPVKADAKADRKAEAKAQAPKAETPKRKRDGKAVYAEIWELVQAGKHAEAITLAEERKWEPVAERIRKLADKRAERAAEQAEQPAEKPVRQRRQRKGAPTANRPQAFPPSCKTEAELVLWWAKCAEQGHRDVLVGARMLTGKAIHAATRANDKGALRIQRKRMEALGTLLSAMAVKAKRSA
jgi:hypothetical protein